MVIWLSFYTSRGHEVSDLFSINLRTVEFENTMKASPKTLHANLILHLYFVFILNWGFSEAQNGIPEGAASLVFVFDTTGSMYDDLIQVRAGAAKILSTTLERKVKPLYNYVLIPFHDPGKCFRITLAILFNYAQLCTSSTTYRDDIKVR